MLVIASIVAHLGPENIYDTTSQLFKLELDSHAQVFIRYPFSSFLPPLISFSLFSAASPLQLYFFYSQRNVLKESNPYTQIKVQSNQKNVHLYDLTHYRAHMHQSENDKLETPYLVTNYY